MMSFAEDAMNKAKKIANSEQTVIRIGTSILRPCKKLIDLWNNIDHKAFPFQLRIVSFDDNPKSFASILSNSKNQIDCFVGPCDSISWQEQFNILQIDKIPCRIAVPRKHPLAQKKSLCWSDLNGETFMLVKRGDSPILNQIRNDIMTNHTSIRIVDVPNYYDTSIFNECEQMNYLMETLDIWEDIHPSLITLPMDWEYKMPYGIVYKKNPSPSFLSFIELIRNSIVNN